MTQHRRLLTAIPGPESLRLHERKQRYVANGVAPALPVYVVRGGDGTLTDADGNRLLDLGSGIAVTTVGNPAPQVTERVTAQAEAFTHTCFMVTPYEGYVEVAEALDQLTPGAHEKKSALFNSGAEAVENAVKIARTHTGRNAVAVFDHAYHGRTNLTMAMTAKNMPYKDGFGPFAPEVYRVPASYPFRDGLTGAEAAAQAITQIEKQVGASNLAAVIIEPIQGEGGFIAPAEGFLPALQKWTSENGVVFVLDEVQTGFARTGDLFAANHEGVVPDLVTTAKGIAGGLPLSAVTGRAEIMDSAHAGGLGGTYAGSPISCAAALAAIEMYETENLTERALEIGAIISEFWTEVQKRDDRIGDVRGRGAMQAIELVESGSKTPNAVLTNAMAKHAGAEGVILLTCGTYGNVIRFLPPLSISDELLREGLQIVADGLAAA